MKANNILDRAISLLEKPGGWTTNSFARDKHDSMIEFKSDKACSFCAIGAILRSMYELGDPNPHILGISSVLKYKIRKAAGLRNIYSVIQFNDRANHKDEIISIFKKAKEIKPERKKRND